MATSPDALSRPILVRQRDGFLTLLGEGLRDLVSRRRLIRYLVRADMKRTHVDSVLGQLWWILDPLLQMGVYIILVTIIFQRATPDYPLFIFAAILPWKWFSTTLNDAATCVTSRNTLIRQIQFPKIVLPAASVAAGTVSFVISLVALAIIYLAYAHRLGPWLLTLPIIAAVQFTFTLALALVLSAANAFFRDVQNVLRHIVRLWFYLSPALYSLDHIDQDGWIYRIEQLNPFTILFTAYRNAIYGTEAGAWAAPDFVGLGALFAVSLVLVGLGTMAFKRVEPAFARIL